MNHAAPALCEMPGMWRRSLRIDADGIRDFTAQARWLQAPSLFVDLRQSAAMPDFVQRRCLNELTFADCTQLAAQYGSAGHCGFDGDCFEWLHLIDFQPGNGRAEAARLWWEDQVLVQAGRDVAYIEHWMRDPTVVTSPVAAVRLRDIDSGTAAVAVRVGTVFMFARDRSRVLSVSGSLAECVAGAASLADARAMLDCEITLGSTGFGAGSGDLVLASTHPWRVSERFVLTCTDSTARSVDIDPTGSAWERRWEVIEAEGDPGAVWPPRG
ncbi:MAG TPA: hypothetical protein VGG00_04810 [Rhodanobacter sp.]